MFSHSLVAIEVYEKTLAGEEPKRVLPWFTGPLIASSSSVLPLGYVNFEPYLFLTGISSNYNSEWKTVEVPFFWIYSFQFPLQVGMTRWMDFTFTPVVNCKETRGQSCWTFGDLRAGLDFQLCFETKWRPGVKLTLIEIFPTGKYDQLNPKKLKTDTSGIGSYQSVIGLTLGKLIQIRDIHYLSSRFALNYTIPSSVFIKGYNFNGGNANTKGTFYPAQAFEADLGLEYSLTQRWALALDVICAYAPKTRFKGVDGAGMTNGSTAQWSLAPALEYNWSVQWGVIAGCWFTAAGRNTHAFQSGVIAINYYNK